MSRGLGRLQRAILTEVEARAPHLYRIPGQAWQPRLIPLSFLVRLIGDGVEAKHFAAAARAARGLHERGLVKIFRIAARPGSRSAARIMCLGPVGLTTRMIDRIDLDAARHAHLDMSQGPRAARQMRRAMSTLLGSR